MEKFIKEVLPDITFLNEEFENLKDELNITFSLNNNITEEFKNNLNKEINKKRYENVTFKIGVDTIYKYTLPIEVKYKEKENTSGFSLYHFVLSYNFENKKYEVNDIKYKDENKNLLIIWLEGKNRHITIHKTESNEFMDIKLSNRKCSFFAKLNNETSSILNDIKQNCKTTSQAKKLMQRLLYTEKFTQEEKEFEMLVNDDNLESLGFSNHINHFKHMLEYTHNYSMIKTKP